MTDRPLIMVGFVPPLPALAHLFADRSVILVEEPDVIRKRGVAEALAGSPMLRELLPVEYGLPGAADAFFNARPELDPALVAPLVEYATPFAARLAERYGRPGAGYGAALTMRDKSLLRKVTAAAGIRNPESVTVSGPDDVRAFMAGQPGPVVLKPANRQGSTGTEIVPTVSTLDEAWARCVPQDEGAMVPDRPFPLHMLCERYVRGHEYSVEMLVHQGEPVFTNITDKLLYPSARPVELGHLVPAELPERTAAQLRARTVEVLRATGFGSGVLHCEWIVDDEGPCLVECAGRFPGDGIVELIERAYPVELILSYFTVLRGERPPTLPDRAQAATAVRFLAVEPGLVESVSGLEAAEALPGVAHASVSVRPGDEVRELRSSWDRVGSVLTRAATAGEAMKLAEQAAELIDIAIRPL
jgi:biotin carboxylase